MVNGIIIKKVIPVSLDIAEMKKQNAESSKYKLNL
jgi:hypothetical protein